MFYPVFMKIRLQKEMQSHNYVLVGIKGSTVIKIKALKTLVWHLLREPMKEISSLKNKQSVMYDEQVRGNKAKD